MRWGRTKIDLADQAIRRQELLDLVQEAWKWARNSNHPYRDHFKLTAYYVRESFQKWSRVKIERTLAAARAAEDMRARHADRFTLAGGTIGGGVALTAGILHTLQALVIALAALGPLFLAWQRLAQDKERIREREWGAVATLLVDHRAKLIQQEEAAP